MKKLLAQLFTGGLVSLLIFTTIGILLAVFTSCSTYQISLDSLSEEQKEKILNRNNINVTPYYNLWNDPFLYGNNIWFNRHWNYGYNLYPQPRRFYRQYRSVPRARRGTRPGNNNRRHTSPSRIPSRSIPKGGKGDKK